MVEPAWALATRLPEQGDWSDEEYLEIARDRLRIELSDGVIELLPVPTKSHQNMVRALLFLLYAHAKATGGTSSFAGSRIRLRAGRYREPDLLYASKEHLHLAGEEHWTGADLVMEVVSGSAEDRVRDLVKKRREYAVAKIPEYWIVDPGSETITVLRLGDEGYAEHGVFGRGTVATSAAFEGLSAEVSSVLDAD